MSDTISEASQGSETTQSTELNPGDSITVYSGEEVFSPVQYHSFRIGGHFVTTTVKEGETGEAAFTRLHEFLKRMKKQEFIDGKEAFYERLRESRPKFSEIP